MQKRQLATDARNHYSPDTESDARNDYKLVSLQSSHPQSPTKHSTHLQEISGRADKAAQADMYTAPNLNFLLTQITTG